jgi:molybdate transport system ATP-binding protein
MPAQTSPLITLNNVSVTRHGKTLLHDIEWEIYPGQNWAIVGPNGAGKSLLMQVVQGQCPCFPGHVSYGGGPVPPRIAQVSFELHQQLMAYERNQEFFRQFSQSEPGGTTVRQLLDGAQAAAESPGLADLSQLMDIEHLLDASLQTLSNGEMRKVLIARALRRAPQILILDEPYDGLDDSSQRRLTTLLHRLAPLGAQILLVTHRLEEMSDLITHILCLQDGNVRLSGERQPILEGRELSQLYPAPVSPQLQFEQTDSRQPATVDPVPTVVMKDVTVTYGDKVVLDRLNWVVNQNEHWAIVGPNGAGKTTLLRLISADHLQAYANEIYLFGRRRGSGESIWDIKQRIGLLSPEFQNGYTESLRAGDVVLSGFFDSVGLYRRADATQKARAEVWVRWLKIESLADENFDRLSYGQQRLILLARALVKSPQMLLLDEPCQGLDAENCRRLVQTVSSVAAEAGTQILYVTHRRRELPVCITHILELRPSSADRAQRAHYVAEIHSV